MYSDTDINAAVTAGAISEEAASAFRGHVESASGLSISDREHQRYYSGYHEYLALAASLILALGVAVLIGTSSLIGGSLAGLLTFWGTSELFVRKQGSTYCAIWFCVLMWIAGTVALLAMFNGEEVIKNPQFAMMMGEVEPKSFIYTLGGSQFILAAVFGLYFWRFRQPISAYMIALTLVFGLLALLVGANYPDFMSGKALMWAVFILGLILLGVSLFLDSTDKARTGLAGETATWLHALAAGLLGPGLFGIVGASFMGDPSQMDSGAGIGVIILLLFFLLALLSLAINRRAYAAASITYPIVGLVALLSDEAPGAKLFAGSAILVGIGMCSLAYFWPGVRAGLVSKLPSGLQAKLPAYRGQVLTTDQLD